MQNRKYGAIWNSRIYYFGFNVVNVKTTEK